MIQTRYLNANTKGHLEEAAALLCAHKLVAFPTETVYGLGALALDDNSVAAIFEAKQRPSHNPLIVHVATREAARTLFCFEQAEHPLVKERFETLAQHFWPGPLTLVAAKAACVSDRITAHSPKVAVRLPSHPVALRLLQLVGAPVVAPSANLFTRPSPTASEHVLHSLDGRIHAVLDGGWSDFGIESTVVDIDGETPQILRPGAIPFADLQRVLPDLRAHNESHKAQSSPGQCLKHYAPNLDEVSLVDSAQLAQAWFGSSALIVRASTRQQLATQLGTRPPSAGPLQELPDDAKGMAQALFGAFYAIEKSGAKKLLIEALVSDNESHFAGVCDRLKRACAKTL